jgi:uncharacterized protein YdbL (DUF1318 family)
MKHPMVRLFCILALTLGAVSPVVAQDLGAIKSRMEARIPALDGFKASGVVGETNRGLVEVRAENAEASKVVAAENADRAAVYAALAKQTGATAESVALARAKQIATASKPGVWLQREDGGWYKK